MTQISGYSSFIIFEAAILKIHWEMCKELKFDQTNKWYMHNPAPVLEDNT